MNRNPGSAVTAEHIDAQLRELTRRVSEVSADFTAFVGAGPAEPARPQVQYATPRAYEDTYRQAPAPYPPAPHPPAPHPQPPAAARRTVAEGLSSAAERGVVGRVLAAFGVGITLIGVVLLLVLAAQAGLLRPEARVAGGAVFAVALFAAGARIGRRPAKRPGAAALVATGVAAALLDVLACTTIYHWLPPVAAVLIGAAIAGGGLVLAHRWDSQALCLMVSVPLLVFAPEVTWGVDGTLVVFMIAYAAATLWLQRGRDWTAVFLVNTVATSVPLIAVTVSVAPVDSFFGASTRVVFGSTVVGNLILALASALILLPSSTRPVLVALGSAAAGVPVLTVFGVLDRPSAIALAAVCALLPALTAIGTAHRASVGVGARAVWLSTASVIATVTVVCASTHAAAAAALLGTALVMAVAVRYAGELQRTLLIIATVIAGIGLWAMVFEGAVIQLTDVDSLRTQERAGLLAAAVVGITATGLLTVAWADRARSRAALCWTFGGLLGLGLVTQACLAAAQLITGGTETGFRAGHTVATLLWFAAAAAALIRARGLDRGPRAVALTAGLAVSVAAVGKLFLFDLATLDGLLRVVAFVAAGLVLLALGVSYAQSLGGDEGAHGLRPQAPSGPHR